MGLLESIGLLFLIFTSTLGTITLGYFTWLGVVTLRRQRSRGEIEEDGAIKRDVMLRAIERSAQ